jgi:hypothetical protein
MVSEYGLWTMCSWSFLFYQLRFSTTLDAVGLVTGDNSLADFYKKSIILSSLLRSFNPSTVQYCRSQTQPFFLFIYPLFENKVFGWVFSLFTHARVSEGLCQM